MAKSKARKRGTVAAGGRSRKSITRRSATWQNDLHDPFAKIQEAIKALQHLRPWLVQLTHFETRREEPSIFPTFGQAQPFTIPSSGPITFTATFLSDEYPDELFRMFQDNMGKHLEVYFVLRPKPFVPPVIIPPKSTKTSTRRKSRRASTARVRRTKRHK